MKPEEIEADISALHRHYANVNHALQNELTFCHRRNFTLEVACLIRVKETAESMRFKLEDMMDKHGLEYKFKY